MKPVTVLGPKGGLLGQDGDIRALAERDARRGRSPASLPGSQIDPKLKAFVEELMIHSHEEERLFFPALRRAMGRSELEALGRLIQNAREVRPDEPVVGGLAERAISYLLASWRAQLDNVFERVSAKVLRTSHP